MDRIGNDNNVYPAAPQAALAAREPDAHGQAAMLLVESLIHGLIAKSVISVDNAIDILDVATEVKAEIGADLGDSPATLTRSLKLLDNIRESLAIDTPGR